MLYNSGRLSQKEVYDILKELGGIASAQQISMRAKEKFPEFTLHLYVVNRLKKLQKNGFVERVIMDGKVFWKIVAEFQ